MDRNDKGQFIPGHTMPLNHPWRSKKRCSKWSKTKKAIDTEDKSLNFKWVDKEK